MTTDEPAEAICSACEEKPIHADCAAAHAALALRQGRPMTPDPTRDALQRIVAEVEASNTIRLTLATTVLAIAREALAAADNDQHIRLPRWAADFALQFFRNDDPERRCRRCTEVKCQWCEEEAEAAAALRSALAAQEGARR